MRFLWDIVRLLVVSSALIGADGAPFSSTDGATLEKRYTASNVGTCSGGMWSVAEANASFNSHFSTDFTTASVIGQDLGISVNTIGAGTYSPYARQFKQANTILTSGVGLKMVVPGGQAGNAPDPNTGDPTITSSQVTTNYDDVLYASVRTVAMLSDVAGTVAGQSRACRTLHETIMLTFACQVSSFTPMTLRKPILRSGPSYPLRFGTRISAPGL